MSALTFTERREMLKISKEDIEAVHVIDSATMETAGNGRPLWKDAKQVTVYTRVGHVIVLTDPDDMEEFLKDA